MKEKNVLAVIPARGGSKGMPGKNIKAFAGKPLIVHSIESSLKCSLISRTVVSTDDGKIVEISDDAHLVNDQSDTSEISDY